VTRVSTTHRSRLPIALLAAVAVIFAAVGGAGCSDSDPSRERAETRNAATNEPIESGMVTVADGAHPLAGLYVAGDRLYGLDGDARPERLAAPINTTFLGTLSPAAVRDPANDARVVYNSWRRRSPVLRVRDITTHEDAVLDEGAFSLAWRGDGALAYFKALRPELDPQCIKRYVGHVVVRHSPEAGADRWTRNARRYVVAAWAGDRLLVYRITKRWPELLVLDGPNRVRVLARDAALVAVSPDGERAFVSTYGADPPIVRVLDVADGSRAAGFILDAGSGDGGDRIRWLTESGSWAGEHVFAASSAGILVFRVADEKIEVEQTLRFNFGSFPLGIFEPQSDESGRRVVAWAQLEQQPRQAVPDAVVLECDRIALRCVQGPPVSSAVGPRLVYNPSRP
jgi:hypothetical protein